MEHIINPVYYQDFILAGNCEFTLRSLKTGNEEMFVVKSSRQERAYWVNNRSREWIGSIIMLDADENIWTFNQRQKDITIFQANQIKIFNWFWERMLSDSDSLKKIQIINPYNRCAHCHRTLTHPESIPIGIGPDCFKKLGLTHKTLAT